MTRAAPAASPAVTAFHALHRSGCFVMPNPWDAGSALFLAHLGFRALATTEAGFAFSRGLPDEIGAVPLDLVIAHVRELVAATPLPVNADFQDGYAREPERVADNVAACHDRRRRSLDRGRDRRSATRRSTSATSRSSEFEPRARRSTPAAARWC